MNHELTNRHFTAVREYYDQQLEKIIKITDQRDHLESDEHKNMEEMWYCEACGKNKNINSKFSHNKSSAHIQEKFNL